MEWLVLAVLVGLAVIVHITVCACRIRADVRPWEDRRKKG